jgi:transposase
MLLVTHRHDTDIRTATVNLFKSLLLGAGELRETLRGLSTARQIRTVLALPDPAQNAAADVETRVRVQALRRAATTVLELDKTITTAEKELRTLADQCCPGLLDGARRRPDHRRHPAHRLVPPRPRAQ